jgi:hypothetical protein
MSKPQPYTMEEMPVPPTWWNADWDRVAATVAALEEARSAASTALEMHAAVVAVNAARGELVSRVCALLEMSSEKNHERDVIHVLEEKLKEAELLRAESDVRTGAWCKGNRDEGRGPCGTCPWCYAEARRERDEAQAEVERLHLRWHNEPNGVSAVKPTDSPDGAHVKVFNRADKAEAALAVQKAAVVAVLQEALDEVRQDSEGWEVLTEVIAAVEAIP